MRIGSLLSWSLLCLLAPGLSAQQVQRQTWTTEEGLPQNSVHALLQSRDGYLWVATENGVARFNGMRFRRYFSGNEPAFASDDICCIVEQPGGRLLFGTANGVVTGQDEGFHRLSGVEGEVTAIVAEADSTAVVLADGKLFRVQGDAATPLLLPEGAGVTAIGLAANKSVLAVADTALFHLTLQGIQRVGTLPQSPLQLAEIAPDQLWTATASEVNLLDAKLQIVHRWRVEKDLPGSRVESLQPWPGGVLVGVNRGAALLRSNGSAEPVGEVAGSAVLSAVLDREGDGWFGTDSGGLIALRERAIASSAALAGESVTALATANDGALWVGTRDAGVQQLRSDRAVASPRGLASQVVLSLAAGERDDVWVGSPEGLDHVTSGSVRHWTAADGLPDDFVRALLAVSADTVWVGTRRGAAILQDGHVQRVLTVADGLPGDTIGTMLRDRDATTVWIGTTAGLARWNGNTLERIPTQTNVRAAVASLLQSSDGTIWAGTSEGLFTVRDRRLVPVGGPALHTSITAVLADALGDLWMRTATGILRARAAALQGCVNRSVCAASVRHFGVADGMPSVELPTLGAPVAATAVDGSLWFATRRGAAHVIPQSNTAPMVVPGVAIEGAVLDERPVPYRPQLDVGAASRRVTLTFAGLSLRAPAQVQYRYLLDGFDKAWSPWESGNVADYTNLPPGSFTFRVQARSVEGAVSAADATVAIRVQAPFYRRWWFYLGVLALAGAIAYGLYWLRLRRVRRDYEAVLQERNRIAREIHDTLAQDFVAVSLQLEVTSQLLQVGATDAAHQQIDATRTLVRDGIQDARESIWALRAGGSGETLPARLATVVKSVEHAALLVTGAYRPLPPSREREIFRIAKESLGNATRHARALHIQIDLLYSEDAVVLRVSDDGAGFDVVEAARLAGHYGVRGMRERAAAMGAGLTVQSSPGHGTCVELRLPTDSKRGA